MDTYIVKVPTEGDVEIVPFNAHDCYTQIHEAVGGYIEGVYIPRIHSKETYAIDCFVDEEGRIKDPVLPPNLRLSNWLGQPIVGNAVFVAHNGEGDAVGLSKADAEYIRSIL